MKNVKDQFQACEICGSHSWQVTYEGKIRDGAFGNLTEEDCTVARCGQCGVDRLNESACKDTETYESDAYRNLLDEPTDAEGFLAKHDETQLRNLSALWPDPLRNKVIADIGCAGGSFLDHVSGLGRTIISVEPCKAYHDSLRKRGYRVYDFPEDAAEEWAGKVDVLFCFSVIEHISSPRLFLEEIRNLMSPDGKVIVSTPNRRDLLMELKGDAYRRFFYRSVHRWYFDVESFRYCAESGGLKVTESQYVHRFGLSNAMAWLRDGRPTGNQSLPFLDSPLLDNFWKGYLESEGVGDYLYFKLAKEG